MEDLACNFTSHGRYFMVRCPRCKMENYAPMVAEGICAWCGFSPGTEAVTAPLDKSPSPKNLKAEALVGA